MAWRCAIKKVLRLFLVFFYWIVILEGSSRLIISSPQIYGKWIAPTPKDNITWNWKWVQRNKRGLTVYYSFDQYDPLKGWSLKPGLSNFSCFDHKILNSNSKGIRGKIEYPYEKQKNKLRLLTLGDSFTFGDEVSDDETYPHYLEQTLPNAEVLNLGVHGYGHDQMLIYLKEEGLKYKPDIIILGYLAIDSERNMLRFRDYAKPKFKLKNDRLVLENSPVPPPETTRRNTRRQSKFIALLEIFKDRVFKKTTLYKKEERKLTEAILREIVVTSKNSGAIPIFVYLSNLRDEKTSEGMSEEELDFSSICKKIEVDCVFLRENVQHEIRKGLKIKDEGHYDAKTNEIIGSGIKDYLTKNRLI